MVFSNLSHSEKDAFFSLLDEYFQSRPELAAGLKAAGSGGAETASVAGRVAAAASAFSNQNAPPPLRRPTGPASPPPAPRGLVTTQKLGDVDTSSKKSMVVSGLLAKKQTPSNTPPPAPSAFAQRKNNFGPPPRHHEPEPEPEQEQEETHGEWAEALYDYDSNDPHDLEIRANQRILVTERTSDDWWTGEVDGKSGLFPATYVKLL